MTTANISAVILDSRKENGSTCFLSRISLESYISALSSTYQDYAVQRGLVGNVYLDHLVETVLARKHIPPIVLVVEATDFTRKDAVLEIRNFKILDGLQRTIRLQAIRNTVRYCLEQLSATESYLDWNKFRLSRTFSEHLRGINSNTEILRAIIAARTNVGDDGLLKVFTENGQWFEVWTGLTPEDEVRKMLLLNAGHKPVTTRHQLELLFLTLLDQLRSGASTDFKLVREKEVSATQFSKKRESGQFHFAHVITGLLSLFAGRPLAPTTELIQGLQRSESSGADDLQGLSAEVLQAFVATLLRLDKVLSHRYGDVGRLWMGREVALAGLFAALGILARNSEKSPADVMRNFADLIASNPGVLSLEAFEEARNSLDLSKVNIGNANRAAIFSAITEIVGGQAKSVDWRHHFGAAAR